MVGVVYLASEDQVFQEEDEAIGVWGGSDKDAVWAEMVLGAIKETGWVGDVFQEFTGYDYVEGPVQG